VVKTNLIGRLSAPLTIISAVSEEVDGVAVRSLMRTYYIITSVTCTLLGRSGRRAVKFTTRSIIRACLLLLNKGDGVTLWSICTILASYHMVGWRWEGSAKAFPTRADLV